ncbi:MAG: hypothetical protein A2Z29_04515 [Chloroflexi bacterium RBG_16_56_11]|nr:MAG: hypothetical protein A2Z29_04515 [Chloroflexi bacterium RBG_16_56_11]
MAEKGKYNRKKAADDLGKVMKTFGETVGQIFNDPELREKAKEFSQSIVNSAAKVIDSRIKDNEVKAKFRDVGKAAQTLGKSITDNFKTAE